MQQHFDFNSDNLLVTFGNAKIQVYLNDFMNIECDSILNWCSKDQTIIKLAQEGKNHKYVIAASLPYKEK